tara:strand:- start:1842 stop:2084 length:243 start_codon:yes stop_codon:yes gene_type:complete
MVRKNHGALVIGTLSVGAVALLALAVGIPMFLFGIGTVIKFFQIMWSPVASGTIPTWSLFVIGLLVLLFMKRKRLTGSYI